jgi:hypothetical protein
MGNRFFLCLGLYTACHFRCAFIRSFTPSPVRCALYIVRLHRHESIGKTGPYCIQSCYMDILNKERFGSFVVTYRQGLIDPSLVMRQLSNFHETIAKGRGEIKILSVGDKLLACRKYIHGGLLRGITRDTFYSEKRAAAELKIMMYLEENGFSVVRPCGYITKSNLCTKDLYFLTFFEEKALDLLEFLKSAHRKERLRAIKNLARLLFRMGKLGVYHPDLHLQNVLVTKAGNLIFLDFDKAFRKVVEKKDMETMFWRLNRFAEKKINAGELAVTFEEKTLFLRTIEQLSGHRIIEDMQKKLKSKRRVFTLGWCLESLFYGHQIGNR